MTFMLRRSVVAPVRTSDFIRYTTEPSATAQASASALLRKRFPQSHVRRTKGPASSHRL